MKQLWAPWRMTYIDGSDSVVPGCCIFCLRDREIEDESRLVLRRGSESMVIMNRYPYTNGHVMIAPYEHTANLGQLNTATVLEMHGLTVLAQQALQQVMNPHGFNLGYNFGRAGGAGVEDHLHLHLVPRWQGDTNFMTVFGEVRVIPQHIKESYDLLREAMQGPLPQFTTD